MKKALVILLSLLVVGGVFADGPTFSFEGSIEGGFGMLGGESFDDPVFGVVSPHMGVNGIRGNVTFNGRNADGTAGFQARVRATGATNAGFGDAITLQQAWAWVKPFGDILEFRGGRYWDGVLNTLTPMVDATLFDNTGLAAYLRPMDMLTVGVGAYAPRVLGSGLPYDGGDGDGTSVTVDGVTTTTNLWGLGFWAGLGVHLDILDLRAHLGVTDAAMDAVIGLHVSALDILPIWAQLRLWNLNDFSEAGYMAAHVFVGLRLIQDVGINIGFALGMDQKDDTDMSMAFGGWFNYTALGNIVPRLDLWYVMGGRYNYGNGLHVQTPVYRDGFTNNSDNAYFNARLMVEFRAAPNMLWHIGGLVNVGLDGDKIPEATRRDGVDYGFFTGVRVTL